jgi:cation diffusion facilitator CzcD-associated flavoprotein CzcO
MEQMAADVVVIGTGPGGMAAVAAAVAEDAEVVVMEMMDRIGGNAVWSTACLTLVDWKCSDGPGWADLKLNGRT